MAPKVAAPEWGITNDPLGFIAWLHESEPRTLSVMGNPTVFSRRALGILALTAVVLAAISFAIVDVSIANANGCIGVSGPCADTAMPTVAVAFAIIGTLSLLISVLPAIRWFSGAIHHSNHDADIESMRLVMPVYEEEL